jgi:hypothetical protein
MNDTKLSDTNNVIHLNRPQPIKRVGYTQVVEAVNSMKNFYFFEDKKPEDFDRQLALILKKIDEEKAAEALSQDTESNRKRGRKEYFLSNSKISYAEKQQSAKP